MHLVFGSYFESDPNFHGLLQVIEFEANSKVPVLDISEKVSWHAAYSGCVCSSILGICFHLSKVRLQVNAIQFVFLSLVCRNEKFLGSGSWGWLVLLFHLFCEMLVVCEYLIRNCFLNCGHLPNPDLSQGLCVNYQYITCLYEIMLIHNIDLSYCFHSPACTFPI